MFGRNYFNKNACRRILKQALILLSASTCFWSCSNFLDGNQLFQELNSEIEYQNAKETELLIQAEVNQGKTNPNGSQKKKMGYEFEIKFNSSENYQFHQWIVVDSETGKPIDSAVTFEDKSSSSTKAVVHKETANMWIKPECFLIPKVTGIIPEYKATGKEQDSSIIITFNNPVKKEDFDGTFANIEITMDDQDLLMGEDCYFELSELSADGKQVTIKTIKSKRLLPEDSLFAYKNIDVKIKLSALTDINNTAFKEDFDYTYKINKNTDNVIPELVDLKIYRTKNEDGSYSNPLTLSEIDQWSEEQFAQNHLKDKIYVYIKARDEGDGICGSRIKEEQLYYTLGEASGYKTDYQSSNAIFTEAGDNCFESYFEYTLTPEYDGIEKIETCIYDFAGNCLDLQSFYVIKDTDYNSSLWRFTNSFNDKPSADDSDRLSTTIYWTSIEDTYATYNDVSYKSSMEKLNIKLSYGNDLENLTEVELKPENITYEEHNYLQDTLYFDDFSESFASWFFDALNSGCYTIPYGDITKDTYVKFTISDEAGNQESETFVIPAVRNFSSHNFSEEDGCFSNIYITDPGQNSLVEKPMIYRVYDSDESSYCFQRKSAFKLTNSSQDKVYLQSVYYFKETPNQSTFFSPWSNCYSSENADTVPAIVDFKIEKDLSKNMKGEEYCYKVTMDAADYNSSYKYLLTTSNYDKVNHLMSFVKEGTEMVHYFYHEHKDMEDTRFTIYIINGSSCTQKIEICERDYETTKKDVEGPAITNWENYYSPAGGFCFDTCYDESGFKPYSQNKNFSKIEYFYIPYLSIYKYNPLNLSESEMDNYRKTAAFFSITDCNKLSAGYKCPSDPDEGYDTTGYVIDFDTKDLEDGKTYTLYAKVYDGKDNCTYKAIKNVCSNPLSEKINCAYSDSKITASIKPETGFYDYKLVWETFDKDKQCWNLNVKNYEDDYDEDGYYFGYNLSGLEYMDESEDNLYSLSVPENSDQFVRLCVYARKNAENNFLFARNDAEAVYEITTSKTQYIYTGSTTKCAVKNMIAGLSGVTIFCDKPCLYYICTSSTGYGDDQDKWERYGARILYNQIDSSCNIDDSLVQPGDKYVVIARFADNTTLMSPVMQK